MMMVGSGPGRDPGPGDGFTTAGFVVAVGFSMLFFVLLANLMAVQYGRGVVRVALDEGARHGARYGVAGPACELRIREVLDGLLGGEMGSGVFYRCEGGSNRISASAQVVFPAWVPGIPEFRFQMAATAAAERK
ncbi:MAG: hypothetical protein OXQ32_12450 [bacterium]|nr:hypothetical protein [bacterium]